MRRSLLTSVGVAAVCAACATGDVPPSEPDYVLAGASADVAFGCGMRLVNELGFTVADADRPAGFIRAERNRTGLGEALLGGTQSYDVLTLTVYPRQGDARPLLRVVADGYEVQARGDNAGGRIGAGASTGGARAARAILDACRDEAGA